MARHRCGPGGLHEAPRPVRVTGFSYELLSYISFYRSGHGRSREPFLAIVEEALVQYVGTLRNAENWIADIEAECGAKGETDDG